MEKGKQFQFKEHEAKEALKVLAWSIGSVFVTFLMTLVANTEIPLEYAIFVPFVNTILYALKEFIADNTTS